MRSAVRIGWMLVVGALIGGGCSAADEPVVTGDLTIDAPVLGRSDTPAPDPSPPPSSPDSPPEATMPASSTDGSGARVETATATRFGPAETPAPPSVDPDEVEPSRGGVRAMLTPTGVLVGVTGQTDDGYVIETPCGNQRIIAWGQPILGAEVVIDPGHGGDEQGAIGETGLTEAELNLRVARRTASLLADRSISVVLTRNGDYRMPLRQRAALADGIGPRVLVSIHHNTPASAPSTDPGTEVYVQSGSDESRRLGGVLYEEAVGALRQFDVEWSSRSDAGVLIVLNDAGEDAYGISRHAQTTSALIELAYLGNPKEEALLATPDYVDALGAALAAGIERYLTTQDAGTGFVAAPRIFNPDGSTGGGDGCVDPPLE